MRGESLSGPPPRRIGIRDVAQRAGVAISTVSKVFSGKGEVMPALRMRVLTAAAELGYQPNSIAQSLRRGATDLIGFVASDLSDPFSAEIVAGAEFILRPAGYALLVMSSNHEPETDAANVRYLNSRRVDAMLVSPSREDDRGLLAALAEFDGPIVAIESEFRSHFPVDSVCADHRQGMRQAVDHLVRLGHRRIAALTGPLARRSGRERLAGFLESLRSHHCEQRGLPISTDHDAGAAEAEVLRLLDSAAPPTALLAGGLALLTGTLRALHKRELAPGRDLALIGWDDGPLAELSVPPIAVVDRDPRGLGAAAAALALKRLGHRGTGDGEPAHVEVHPARFIARASCGSGIDHDIQFGGLAHG
ncbi:MAG TPA: LacI family DNA-binding transcriptional regulator [Bauldia sp.]|nr:LacI family DNA-binding transcriptional regulator [Bauldia sp.]